jgi:uncharacterized membrane protein
MKKTSATVTAISSLLTLGAAALATPTFAADKAEMEKCYGVVKAGKNDCAGPAHACAGQAKVDSGGKEFLTVPKGTCARLAGGSLTPK